MTARLACLLGILVLAFGGCERREDEIRIGAKNFAESRILAEMMAALATEQGLQVRAVVDYPSTQVILEALKLGEIDAYPDYNGTGLVMVGQNPTPDGDEAMARVRALYEPLGLTWLDRIGFANDYALVMRAERAADLGIETISDLVGRAPQLTLAVEDDFTTRPLDGLDPLRARYGMEFGEVEVVPLDERGRVYDMLIDGEADVAEGYATDGQIADYGLVVLEDDLQFFPVYQAAPLVRSETLARHPGLAAALNALAGKIDAETMRELNRRAEIEGRPAQAVARDALARMGLIEAGAVEAVDPLVIATDAPFSDGALAATTLRAARAAFSGRDVQLTAMPGPTRAVLAGDARLALVGADAFFDLSTPAPTRAEDLEAVAAVGEAVVHVIAARSNPDALDGLETLAVGPEGSSSARIGAALVSGLGLAAELVQLPDGSVAALAEAVTSGAAEGAVIVAPAGDNAVAAAFAGGDLKLLPVAGWKEGANLVRFPFLREARLPSGVYPAQFGALDTLRLQLVLAGPAPQEEDAIGEQGPSSIATRELALSDTAVTALNAAIPGTPRVDPALPQAAALTPTLPSPPAAMNPAPDISVLSVALVLFLMWLVWLYMRPRYR
jgi:glycine betaine/choline ABC-type transport system substrate-binding protein/TRAP-type uncharacterized transport system substrate-binding protein